MRTRLFNAAKMIVGGLLLASVPACNLDPAFAERRPPKGPTTSAENPRSTGLPPSSTLSTVERQEVDLVESVLAHRAQYHQELEGLRDYYRDHGYFQQTPQPYADLGEIVTGQKPGRTSAEQRTMAINLGLALEDIMVAPRVYALARERGIGTELPL